MDVVGQRAGVVASASEDVNRQQASVRIAVCADMTLVDEDDGCEAGRTLTTVKLRDVRMDLSNTGFTDTFSQNLKHPLSVEIDWW
jgi:hypothetical protein